MLAHSQNYDVMVAKTDLYSCQDFGQIRELVKSTPLYENTGFLTHGSVDECAQSITSLLTESRSCEGLVRRTYKVVVELLENVWRHGQYVELLEKHPSSISVWIETDHSVVLSVCNVIRSEEVSALDRRLNGVVLMPFPEVKEEIRRGLLLPGFTPHGGAGIGLLTVRQLTHEIVWDFRDQSDELVLFTIMVRVV